MQFIPQASSVGSGSSASHMVVNDEASDRRRVKRSKYDLYSSVEEIMFGSGDSWPPNADSVELVEDLAIKYIRSLCCRALDVADLTGKLDKQCFLFAVRKDPRKFARAITLLKANSELKYTQTSVIAEEEEKVDANPVKVDKKSKSKTNKQAPADAMQGSQLDTDDTR